jgi:hypothetical protein
MSSNTIYHYVYRITNIVAKKHYYGKRSSKCDPKLDLGVKYFSSSTDKEFIQDQKLNSQNYRYKILQTFSSGSLAILRESKLHHKFNVGNNPNFYNKINQTPNGFDHSSIEFSKETRAKISNALKGRFVSNETRAKLSKAYTGLKRSKETIARVKEAGTYKGKNNPMFRGYFKTPSGIFDSEIDIKELKIRKHWCIHPDKLIGRISYHRSEYLKANFTWDFICDKTFGEIGFGFIPKEEYQLVRA